jgi:hypothetical protein
MCIPIKTFHLLSCRCFNPNEKKTKRADPKPSKEKEMK